jgi:hypothetical protein
MATQGRSIEAAGGAPMGEMVLGTRRRDWSWVGAIDNGVALVLSFIGSYGDIRRAVKGREAVTVKLQFRRLWEMKTGKGRRWGAVIFGGEEGE